MGKRNTRFVTIGEMTYSHPNNPDPSRRVVKGLYQTAFKLSYKERKEIQNVSRNAGNRMAMVHRSRAGTSPPPTRR